MKTTIDIPDKVMHDAMKYTHAKTKKDAVLTALESYNHRARMSRLTGLLGTFDDFLTLKDLRMMRKEEVQLK